MYSSTYNIIRIEYHSIDGQRRNVFLSMWTKSIELNIMRAWCMKWQHIHTILTHRHYREIVQTTDNIQSTMSCDLHKSTFNRISYRIRLYTQMYDNIQIVLDTSKYYTLYIIYLVYTGFCLFLPLLQTTNDIKPTSRSQIGQKKKNTEMKWETELISNTHKKYHWMLKHYAKR